MDLLNASQKQFNDLFTSLDGGLLPNVKDLSHLPVSRHRQAMREVQVEGHKHALRDMSGHPRGQK